MSYCFILASSDDRIDILQKCVECIQKSKYASSDVYLYYQGTKIDGFVYHDFFKGIVTSDHLRGVFTPRYVLMKEFGINYDYVIIIDDDLFMYPDTDYDSAMRFLAFMPSAGCCTILTHRGRRRNEMVNVSDSMGYYNVEGGLVFPQRSIKVILDYFKDKEMDYTEDMWWLLLYIKGFDLWRDYSSSAIHTFNYKNKGKMTGFSKMRTEKPHLPILSEWFDSKLSYEERYGQTLYKIKELKDINKNGRRERMKNYGKTEICD